MTRLRSILAAAERHGTRRALVGKDRALGYGEMLDETARVAARLRDHGVGPGALVLLAGGNSVDWVVTFLSAVNAEALVGILDPATAKEDRERIAEDLGAAAVFTDAGLSFSPSSRETPSRTKAIAEVGGRLLMFTSGSTGTPKGVIVTEENVVANVAWNADAFGLTESSVTCNFMPLSAFLNLSYVVACLAVGATVLVEKNLADLQGTLARMDAAGLTHLNTVPLALRTIVERGDLERYPLALLETVRVGAGVLPFDLAERALERFSGGRGRTRLVATYGMTEIGLVATRVWERGRRTESDVGTYPTVTDGKEVLLVDDPGGAEVTLASPYLHRGYYHVGAARLELRSGPYATGDLGERTETGALRIVGRRKQIAKVAGVLVDLEDLSRAARTCRAVADSAAIGIDHPVLGEEVHLFVAEKAGGACDPSEIASALMAGRPMKRVPRVHVLPSLPRTPMGKIAKGDLERIARGHT